MNPDRLKAAIGATVGAAFLWVAAWTGADVAQIVGLGQDAWTTVATAVGGVLGAWFAGKKSGA